MTREYQARQGDKIWDKLWRTKRPINKNTVEDFPFNVIVTGKGSNVNIDIQPDVKATTNEVLPMISRAIMTKVQAFEHTANSKNNRLHLTNELEKVLMDLWVQGLIEPKPREIEEDKEA